MTEEQTKQLDELYDKMSAFVCEHGPKLLTRGINPLEANEAIMACLESLLLEREHFQSLVGSDGPSMGPNFGTRD